MIIRDDGFIVKGRIFTPSDVERILIKYIETENENKIKDKQREHDEEPLVEYCKRAYENDRTTCDNFHCLLIKRPYTYRGMKKGWAKNCFPDINITKVLKDSNKWKDYSVKTVRHGSDCSITVTAELPCKTVNDLIYYCGNDISKDCVFQEVFNNKIYDLDYVKTYGEKFEETVFVNDVDVNKDKKIICVHFMKNGGNEDA